MKCLNCQEDTTNPKFCSKSCAASFNNKREDLLRLGRRVKTKKCRVCDTLIFQKNSYCPKCILLGKHLRNQKHLKDKTLGEEIDGSKKDANIYNNIRQHARRVCREETYCCDKCGYEKHVEICHIKPIRDFSLDSLVSEINDRSNLVKLCPNCHWELDNGLLIL